MFPGQISRDVLLLDEKIKRQKLLFYGKVSTLCLWTNNIVFGTKAGQGRAGVRESKSVCNNPRDVNCPR